MKFHRLFEAREEFKMIEGSQDLGVRRRTAARVRLSHKVGR